jgi:hypothetical protein
VTVVDGDGATSVSCALCAMAVVGDAAEPVTLVLAAAATAPLIRKDA